MSGSEFTNVYNFPFYPRDSKIHTNKGLVNIDNGSMGGTDWTCFDMKDINSLYFDSFNCPPEKV